MEIKKLSEYSENEKRAILNHLWHYYGKEVIHLMNLISLMGNIYRKE